MEITNSKKTMIDWQKIKVARECAARSLKPLHKTPLIHDSRDFLLKKTADGSSLLDVGANDRNLEKAIQRSARKIDYFSCDIDRSLPHDYYDLSTVDRQFEVICLFDVIEHLHPEIAMNVLEQIFRLLVPGGLVYVTTPNVDHPTRFWRDCTHITPFRYDELAGFVSAAQFDDVEVWRIARYKWQDRLRHVLARPVLRLLGIDFAPSILVVGKKK